MYKESRNTTNPANHSVNDGDTVGAFFERYSGLECISSSTTGAPVLASDATRKNSLLFTGGNKNLQAQNSKGAFRFIHVDQDATLVFWIKFVNALASATEIIVDTNSASTGSNSNGFGLYRNASEQIGLTLSKGVTGSPALGMNGPTINDTAWHYVVVRIARGTNACYIQVDGGTPTTGTISGASSAGADFLYEMTFGLSGASSAPGNMYLGDFAIMEGALAPEDLADFLAYNPDRTSASQAVPTAEGNSLDPDEVLYLHHWHRMTEIATLKKADGTTAVAAADDPVGLVINKKSPLTSSDWKRNLSQTDATKCPTWQLNQLNGLGSARWAGQAAAPDTNDFTGENALLIPSWPVGSFTWICLYQMDVSQVGSHIVARTASEYCVQTSSQYGNNPGDRGDVACHFGNSISITSDKAANPEGVVLLVVRQDGSNVDIAIFNHWGSTGGSATGAGRFAPSHMGRPFKTQPGYTDTLDMRGPIAESIVFAAALDNDTITKIIRPLVTRYGLTGVSGLGSASYSRMGLGLGIGL
jgi:hypothetical protein